MIKLADSVVMNGDYLYKLCTMRAESDPLEGELQIRELFSKRELVVYRITPS